MTAPEKKQVVLCKISPVFADDRVVASPRTLALGLHYIRNYCLVNPRIRENFDIHVRAFGVAASTASIANSLLTDSPLAIGFSAYNVEYEKTVRVAALVKKKHPKTLIVLGGPQFYDPEDALEKHPFADAVIPFEGELTFEDYLLRLAGGDSLSSVSGLAFRDDAGIHFNGFRKEQVAPERIPTVYDEAFLDGITGAVVYQTSRGCPHRCGFCASAADAYREFPLESVTADLRRILAHPNVERLIFADLDLAHDAERFKNILDVLLAHNTRNIRVDGFWSSLPKIEPLLGDMRRAGFIREFGISLQSCDDTTLIESHRNWLTMSKFRKIAPAIASNFPDARIELILGLPEETPESFRAGHLAVFECGFRKFLVMGLMVSPGSEFHRRRKELGLEYRDAVSHEIARTPNFSERELERARDFSTNFQIMAWILQPSDLPLYREWGIDLIAVADRIQTLREHCAAPSEKGISFRQVRESAIDAFTDCLGKEFSFPAGKTALIYEYLHLKFKVHKMEQGARAASRASNDFQPLIAGFMKFKASREVLSALKLDPELSLFDNNGRAPIFAIHHEGHGRAIFTASRNPALYHKVIRALSRSVSRSQALEQIAASDKRMASAMIHQLDEAGFF